MQLDEKTLNKIKAKSLSLTTLAGQLAEKQRQIIANFRASTIGLSIEEQKSKQMVFDLLKIFTQNPSTALTYLLFETISELFVKINSDL